MYTGHGYFGVIVAMFITNPCILIANIQCKTARNVVKMFKSP